MLVSKSRFKNFGIGEIPDGSATILPDDPDLPSFDAYLHFIRRKRNYSTRWAILWLDSSEIGVGIMEQAKSMEMTLSDYRVRDYLISTIGIGNFVSVNKSEISKNLNIHRITVYESIKKLCSLGILIAGSKNGRNCSYMISPAFCFFGKIDNGIKERKEIIKKGNAKIINFNKSINNGDK